ncbi:hypothetical protein FB562_2206 [Homoserinimonas aerilata]|uniref:SPP1 Gp6-like portal protein n=1 Tax=Homoserinimonas aerilata TaxID=1162970 RepID=A0A542YF38_9MICO|nr:hypothetical protein [Homoserinimonas aerilata]TQL46682.1 hypothetical protein FB562_2206 [Homoserinimonas aerilata]
MALPAPNTAWPPAPWDFAYSQYRENEAWYLGDTDELEKIYRREQQEATHVHRGQPMRGGVVGAASRMFWGRPVPTGQSRTRLHVPAPADLATIASDSVFAVPPEVQLAVATSQGASASVVAATPSKEQLRLDEIANSDAAHAMYNTMGELKSVFGATVITSEWDLDISDHVWLASYAVDVVIPEFRKGKLIACTMWTEYVDKSVVFRHLEHHEVGRIQHVLYQGSETNIGRVVALEDRPETAHLAKMINSEAGIVTGLDRLTASYNLNMPTRAWRKKGQLAFAGRSDFAGSLPLFDALDETMSSWMRDLKLAGGKVLVPSSALQSNGVGQGGFFDSGQEFFAGLDVPGEVGKITMDKVQFAIRVDEHERTARALWREIFRAAGQGTRSIDDDGASQVTATGELLRDKREEITRDKKTLYDKRAIAEQSSVALELDGKLFPGKGGGRFEEPVVMFADISQTDPEQLARTIQFLDAAGAASTRRKVELFNPDWDDTKIDEEVKRIVAERGTSAPDPATFTGDPLPNEDENES